MSTKLENLFNYFVGKNRSSCNRYIKESNSCSASRCVCSALAEVFSYMEYCLPHNTSKFELCDFTGICNGEEIIEKANVDLVLNKICKYCFDKDKIDLSQSRNYFNSISVMDKRFSMGTNVIIHGGEKASSDGMKKKSGKTLVASLIMKEAIWRRLFKSNKAFTYYYSPISKIIDDRLSKRESDMLVTPTNCDWLVVDDIYDKNRQIQPSIIEDVFVYRQMKSLPTIFVVKFDASSRNSLEEVLGESLSRCFYGDPNSFIIDIS